MKLSELIAISRESHKLTLRELGKQSGVPSANIYRLEAGITTNPEFFSVLKIAKVLNINPKRLFECEELKP